MNNRMKGTGPITIRDTSHSNVATPKCSNAVHLTMRHHLSLLFIAIFATYYYSILRGGFIQLDDMNLMNRLLNNPSFVLKDLLFPLGVSSYYRPMIELSYWLDHAVWFDMASGWHLTNVILHVLNTWLVFLVSRIVLANAVEDRETAAFWSALLYGLNPLATEAVCWVSGRSELILALFMLSSFSLYLVYKLKGSYRYLLLSAMLYFLAAETKESALVLPVIIIAFEIYFNRIITPKKKENFLASTGFLLVTAVYFLAFRRAGVDTSNVHVGVGASGLTSVSPIENILVFFASVGYYVRKIVSPYPLNFAISSINLEVYAILGFGVFILFAFQWRRLPTVFKFFAAWILISVSPAIAAAVLHIPWVPWAERYLYIPLAGFSMAIGLTFTLYKKRYSYLAACLFVFLIGLSWAMTLQRAYVWADEVRLWSDTTQKSDYGPVHYYYGRSLLKSKRNAEGIAEMNKAIDKGYSYYPYVELSRAAFSTGDYDGSEKWLKNAIRDYPQKAELHAYLAEMYMRMKSRKSESRKFLFKAIDEYVQYATMRQDDAATCLTIAQLYKAAHWESHAVPFLERVIEIDSDSPAAKTALKYLLETDKSEKLMSLRHIKSHDSRSTN